MHLRWEVQCYMYVISYEFCMWDNRLSLFSPYGGETTLTRHKTNIMWVFPRRTLIYFRFEFSLFISLIFTKQCLIILNIKLRLSCIILKYGTSFKLRFIKILATMLTISSLTSFLFLRCSELVRFGGVFLHIF